MNYKSQYQARKKSVIDIIERTIELYRRIGDEENASSLQQLKNSVQKGVFSIVVVGQFSAGKSTFLNALMGEKYLPSFTSETTATINFLRSVKESPTGKQLISINYRDGHTEQCDEVTLENIEKYVSVKGDEVAKKIESVEIYLNSPFLNDGVSLVDSPGLNGVLEGHAQITNEQIDRSHAAIFMFNAHQPGSKTDFEILKQLNERCKSLFVVLNQIDLVKEHEQTVDQVVKDVRDKYASYFGEGCTVPEIYPISAYKALVARSKKHLSFHDRVDFSENEKKVFLQTSLQEDFEDRLYKYLTLGEKAQQELLAPIQKAIAFLQTTAAEVQDKISVLSDGADAEELQKQIDELQAQLSAVEQEMKKDRVDVKKKIGVILSDATNAIKLDIRNAEESYKSQINTSDDLEALSDEALFYVNAMQNKCQLIVTDHLKEAELEFKSLIRERFEEITEEIETKLSETFVSEESGQLKTIVLDTSVFDLDINLDEYYEQRNAIRKKIGEIEDKMMDAEEKIVESQINEAKRARIEAKIERTQGQIPVDTGTYGSRPEGYWKTETIESRPKGLFGYVRWVFKGKPEKDVRVWDDSAGKKYDDAIAAIRADANAKIAKLEAELDRINDTDSFAYQSKLKSLEKAKERLKEDLEDKEREKKGKIEKANRSQMRKARAYLQEFFSTMEHDTLSDVYRQINEMKNEMFIIAEAVVEDGLSAIVQQKQKTLQEHIKQLKSSVEERQEILKKEEQNKSEIKSMLQELSNEEYELLSIEIDTIKQG